MVDAAQAETLTEIRHPRTLVHHAAGQQRSADDHERGGGFQSAHEKHFHSRLCVGESTGKPARANGKRSNGRDCNRRAVLIAGKRFSGSHCIE
jgi:hypothetical protein